MAEISSKATQGPDTVAAAVEAMLRDIWSEAGGNASALARVATIESGSLPSVFAVSDLAAASVAAAGLAVSELIATMGGGKAVVEVDRRLASFWFASSLRPDGWSPPPPWDPIAGDYPAADGWIRLHTNAPHHRAAVLAVLRVEATKSSIERAVATWSAAALEDAVVAKGGCAAKMRSLDEWASHPQGRSVAAEPLLRLSSTADAPSLRLACDAARPLAGVKVLDLTRILAGPVATRFLAGYGAQVLRIDPPDWDEPSLVAEVLLGKRAARLDLRNADDLARFIGLIREADILIHGYRSDALERLGLGSEIRHRARPGLVDVSLDAYGWTGPWRSRRGFDSLVQMSAGIAEAGMRRLGRERPTPLPVQALDHATGYMMAASAVLGLIRRVETGQGQEVKASLARTGLLLTRHSTAVTDEPLRPETKADLDERIESTAWGLARRVRAPVSVDGAPMRWDRSASPIGSDQPRWE
ncbi:CoA-transferase family III [Rhizobiales bacterium GAS188]|nr:CoA-transferase family III [Rhizobiales bacterium GAS188]